MAKTLSQSWQLRAKAELERRRRASESPANPYQPEPDWRKWLQDLFPSYVRAPFADRHIELWEWVERLQPNQRQEAFVAIWPRGGAKSTTAELACVRIGAKRARRYIWYISRTQDKADKHVETIAALLESQALEASDPALASRRVGKYGNSKGWRRNRLRTASGLTIDALGLDVGSRGAKVDDQRPDLMIFDDIDEKHDSPAVIRKLIDTITTTLLPAGSTDCAILFIQNLIHPDSIASQMVDGRADFLINRKVSGPHPAVLGLKYQRGPENRFVITAGAPTWEGQNLEICEGQINDWGPTAFKEEAQQEVNDQGDKFDRAWFEIVRALPAGCIFIRYWDKAGTEGGGDYSAGVLMARAPNGLYYIADVVRGQWSSARREAIIKQTAELDKQRYGNVQIWAEREGGSGGKESAENTIRNLAGFSIRTETVTGSKEVRADPFAAQAEVGNVKLLAGPWNADYLSELAAFPLGANDDQVDGSSGAFNKLAQPRKTRMTMA